MKSILSHPARIAAAGVTALCIGLMLAGPASADERGDRRHEVREPYHSPHWVYDDRFHHGHYYPAIGYSVTVLPPGYLSVGFGNRRFFFQGGVWFAPAGGGFAVVRPPLGVVVPVLPPAATTVWVAGTPYYYANDIYYTAAPGGYVVTAPPAQTTYTEAPPAPQAPPVPAAAPPAAPSAGATWYYCDSAKAYYPYVPECKEGWRPVPATPPQPR